MIHGVAELDMTARMHTRDVTTLMAACVPTGTWVHWMLQQLRVENELTWAKTATRQRIQAVPRRNGESDPAGRENQRTR